MSRQDYQLIAQVLFKTKASDEIIIAMADALVGTNPRFDRTRFIVSCWWKSIDHLSANRKTVGI